MATTTGSVLYDVTDPASNTKTGTLLYDVTEPGSGVKTGTLTYDVTEPTTTGAGQVRVYYGGAWRSGTVTPA